MACTAATAATSQPALEPVASLPELIVGPTAQTAAPETDVSGLDSPLSPLNQPVGASPQPDASAPAVPGDGQVIYKSDGEQPFAQDWIDFAR